MGDVLNTPDSRPLLTSLKAVKVKKTEVTKPSPDIGALDETKRNLQRPTLLKQMHELEIRKLELQLELAKISSPSCKTTQHGRQINQVHGQPQGSPEDPFSPALATQVSLSCSPIYHSQLFAPAISLFSTNIKIHHQIFPTMLS